MATPTFTSSPLYSLETVNALLKRLPSTSSTQKDEEETRIQLLSAKLSLLQSSTSPSGSTLARNGQPAAASREVGSDEKEDRKRAETQQQQQQLDLTETRCELVDCHLRQGNLVLAESEALQVIATCKRIIKLAPTMKPTTGTTSPPSSPAIPQSRTATPSSSTHSGRYPSFASDSRTVESQTPYHLDRVRWTRAYDRALSALVEIDTQRGITGRVERWRGMRDRLRVMPSG
ncbi:hypothetical protein QFC22_003004 [Naganishia vaughanmartiniae]|uniref:Uncharacterized protein n=1 Tax=Naganishia vaughanmartiniae TaxID=1424756 RepID=A0ACC2X9L6_9TREE|nr:hypothetical protein QFC22_003004 [Naganishia vaughanmartiniae]